MCGTYIKYLFFQRKNRYFALAFANWLALVEYK